ncbi:MAG: 3'-5' exonuclease, partial [Pseudomonadota bacterium]
FLPGWEEGLFPSQRTLDESGQAGLEEERRLAYVGITRAKLNSHVSFAQNRRNRGLYQSAIPSRFVDELPEAHVEVVEAASPFGGAYQNYGTMYGEGGGNFGRANPYGQSRFDATQANAADQTYNTPGWARAQERWANAGASGGTTGQPRKMKSSPTKSARRQSTPITIDGELVASSTSTSEFEVGERIFHQKFGYGRISEVEGNKLTVDFEKSGTKRVVDSFVERH